MKAKEISVGFVVKTDTSSEDWASVLIENPEKKLKRFIKKTAFENP